MFSLGFLNPWTRPYHNHNLTQLEAGSNMVGWKWLACVNRYCCTTPALSILYLVAVKDRSREFSFVVYFSDV